MVYPAGFPLEVLLSEGDKAETTTLIPVLRAFAERHGVRDMVVIADAGMLSAANLNALEDAGCDGQGLPPRSLARAHPPQSKPGTAG